MLTMTEKEEKKNWCLGWDSNSQPYAWKVELLLKFLEFGYSTLRYKNYSIKPVPTAPTLFIYITHLEIFILGCNNNKNSSSKVEK